MKFKSKIGRFLGARNKLGIFSGEKELNLHVHVSGVGKESLWGLKIFSHQVGTESELSTLSQ